MEAIKFKKSVNWKLTRKKEMGGRVVAESYIDTSCRKVLPQQTDYSSSIINKLFIVSVHKM